MLRKLTAATAALIIFTVLPLAYAAADPNYNDPAWWEGQTEHPATCYKHEAGAETIHGVDNGDGSVTLHPFNPAWNGDHWELLVVKSGAVDGEWGPGNAAYFHPAAGVPYFGPLNAGGEQGEVSHWIVCKGETPSSTTTSTTTPPTTTTSSTLPPDTTTTTAITTTTVTTVPPSTTTTTVPPSTSTTTPPTTSTPPTSTTVPPTTTTTEPPPATSTTTTTTEPPPPTTTTSDPPDELPYTGLPLITFGLIGLGLLDAGQLLRLRAKRRSG